MASNDHKGTRQFWSPEERLWAQTQQDENGCLIWTGSRVPSNSGAFYGTFSVGGRSVRAHRYAFGVAHGRIPDGFQIHHKETCKNTLCVNPDHLEALSIPAHARRSRNALATHCPSGHPYDDANTRLYQGRRYCKACSVLRGRSRRAKARLANPLWRKSPCLENAEKTHCIRGHAFDEANTYRPPGKNWRQCRICLNEASRRYRLAK